MAEVINEQAPVTATAEAGKTTSTPTPTAQPVTIPLTVDEYNRLRGLETQFNEFKTAKQIEIEAKEQERIKALADKGKVDEALEATNKLHADKLTSESKRYADLEREVHAEKKTAVIAQALAGRQFVSADAAEQVQSILDGKVEVYRDANGKLSVVDKITRRSAAEVLKESLDSPAFAHFLAATSTTGGAGQQGNRASAAQQSEAFKPGSLDAIAANYIAVQGQYPSIGMHPRAK